MAYHYDHILIRYGELSLKGKTEIHLLNSYTKMFVKPYLAFQT